MSTAILLDVTSIQQYIFGSNKLRENIGASYIIEELLFKSILGNIFKGEPIHLPDDYKERYSFSSTTQNVRIVYIGGGNALLLFEGDGRRLAAKNFIYEFTKSVLMNYPGINVAVAQDDNFDMTSSGFADSRRALAMKLTMNKSLYPQMARLPKEGIFEDCQYSNQYAEIDYKSHKSISMESYVKFKACETAQVESFVSIRKDKFILPDELENLGQDPNKGYIAVVHIDGNNIGSKFIKQKSIESLQKLSQDVSSLAYGSMEKLISLVISKMKQLTELLNLDRDVLPIRPILTGGDDITFVCEGRLGIYLAEQFIDIFEKKARELGIGDDIFACAGVAIVKTKYPFFKAYTLAEELCDEAKKVSRSNPQSWISYYVANKSISGKLTNLRAADVVYGNQLSNNPYQLKKNNSNGLANMEDLKACIKVFGGMIENKGDEKWPRSKVMELRSALISDTGTQNYFLAEMKYRKRKLPLKEESLWKVDSTGESKKTYFYDAIQLLDFYPDFLLDIQNIEAHAAV